MTLSLVSTISLGILIGWYVIRVIPNIFKEHPAPITLWDVMIALLPAIMYFLFKTP